MFILLYALVSLLPYAQALSQDQTDSFESCVGHLGDRDLTVVTSSSSNYTNLTQAFNLKYPFDPQAVIFPTSSEEVAQVVGCAFHSNLSISARSGGHSYGGYGLAGDVVVDLSKLKQLEVFSDGTALIQTGNLLGDVATTLWDHGKRALPHGSCPYVGTGGHASLGGYGFYSRLAGLLLDNIQEAEVVLGNGTIVKASTHENSDLFWALRGAGPSFGLVTSWTFQTHAAPETLIDFTINFGALTTEEFTEALVSYENFGTTAPPEIAIQTVVGPNGNGGVFLSFQGDYYGTLDEFHSVVDPWMKTLPSSQTLNATQLDWINGLVAKDGNLSTSAPDVHDTFYAKSLLVSEPSSNQSLSDWVNFMFGEGISSGIGWFAEVDMWGGAIANVSADASSFSHRNAMFGYQLYSSSPGSLPPYPQSQVDFINNMWKTLAGDDTKAAAYTNYVDPLLPDDVWPTAYYNGSFERLTAIKKAYDPWNIFRFNQSIPVGPTHLSDSNPQNNTNDNGGTLPLTLPALTVLLFLGAFSGSLFL